VKISKGKKYHSVAILTVGMFKLNSLNM